jgi:hypothetical protein
VSEERVGDGELIYIKGTKAQVLYTMHHTHYTPRTLPHALYTTHYTLHTIPHALYPMHYTLRTIPHARYSLYTILTVHHTHIHAFRREPPP